jgi:hypothetical protein
MNCKIIENIKPKYFKKIWKLRPDKDQYIKFMGKEIKLPRRIKAFGKNYKGYMGSEKNQNDEEIPRVLLKLRKKLGLEHTNSILINFYSTKENYIGSHRDNDKQLGSNYEIYTFSLYRNEDDYRVLRFINQNDKKDKQEFTIKNNTLFSFNEKINKNYKHEVKKAKHNCDDRISITFRTIV